jgi:hypothetical protein
MFRCLIIPFALLLPSLARADVAAIAPPARPMLGDTIVCTAKDDGQPGATVVAWHWTLRLITPDEVGTMERLGIKGDAGVATFQAGWPGDYLVGCRVSYASAPPKQLSYIVVTVPPPDGARIVAGVPASTWYKAGNLVRSEVLSRGEPCRGHVGGLVQWLRVDKFDWFGRRLPDDTDWFPAAPTSTFVLRDGALEDTHWFFVTDPRRGIGSDAEWAEIPRGATMGFTQRQRILFGYGGRGTPQVLRACELLPAVRFVYTKEDDQDFGTSTR